MNKPRGTKTPSQKKKSESGLTGGPSTIRGVTYQVDHAVYLTLEQMSAALADPFTPRSITLEPRTTAPKVKRWDIRVVPPETTFEAKFNPKREELVDWLRLVGQSSAGAPGRGFRFVYAEERAAAVLIRTLRALIRIATEAGGDEVEFAKLVAHEEVTGADEVLSLLGENAVEILRRIELEQLSDSALDADINLRLMYLTSPDGARGVRNYLFEKLQRAAPSRVAFAINDIVAELRERGFTLNAPQRIDVGSLSPNAYKALSVLEGCKTGLPIEVLAAVTCMSTSDLAAELELISQAHSEGGLWSLAPLGAVLAHPDEAALRARLLEELLSYVKTHGKSLSAQQQVLTIMALAEDCLATHPRLVAGVFGTLDKLLKGMGRKRLVRDAALLTKSAAQRAGVDREMKLAIIRSLICGLTWYYQRVGDLEEANVTASRSYRYAAEVDSKIDLAFSAKCTGRLRRLEAESIAAGGDRRAKLAESLGMLETAIQNFSAADGHGPDGAEVGDCYSLMARTHLVAGDLGEARTKLARAFSRIPDDGSKDQLDALILAGDIEVVAGNKKEAFLQYGTAVEKAQLPGREVTEMRARALRQRGRVSRLLGDPAAAEKDFREATGIWDKLGETNFAAEVEFEMLDLSAGLPTEDLAILEREPAAVRVQALKLHIGQLTKHNQHKVKTVGRRAKLPPKYWDALIKQARDMVGFELV